MDADPSLTTDRLLLRPFAMDDAPMLQTLASDRAIAATTGNIPHPYPAGAAEEFIQGKIDGNPQEQLSFAVVEQADEALLVGAVGLRLAPDHQRGEVGYWIGVPYWGRGYATEATRAVVRFGFAELDLNRIEAHHFASNPASGRVLEKLGMVCEGRFRQHVCKWGELHDTVHYAILRHEYQAFSQNNGKPR